MEIVRNVGALYMRAVGTVHGVKYNEQQHGIIEYKVARRF